MLYMACTRHFLGVFGSKMTSTPAPELRLRIKQQGQEAFTAFVERYRQPLIGFLYRISGAQQIAEEIAQEVFVRTFRSRQRSRASVDLEVTLYQIAIEVVLTAERRPDLQPWTSDAPQQTCGQGWTAKIREQVLTLPLQQRMAVLLHKYQGLDCKQIALVLGLTETKAMSLLLQAYRALSSALRDITPASGD